MCPTTVVEKWSLGSDQDNLLNYVVTTSKYGLKSSLEAHFQVQKQRFKKASFQS